MENLQNAKNFQARFIHIQLLTDLSDVDGSG